jgi:hypothetical protein
LQKNFVDFQEARNAKKNGRTPSHKNKTGEAIGLPGSDESRPKV